MPVIIAHVRLEWISGGWQPYTSRPVATDRSRLMEELIRELRSMTANVVNEINRKGPRFQRAFGPEDTILDVLPVHPWAENVPDLRIEIFVDETEATEEASQERRWSIARDVSATLFHYLDQTRVVARPHPTYSVECTTRASSGITRDSHGGLKQNWGVPDYSQA